MEHAYIFFLPPFFPLEIRLFLPTAIDAVRWRRRERTHRKLWKKKQKSSLWSFVVLPGRRPCNPKPNSTSLFTRLHSWSHTDIPVHTANLGSLIKLSCPSGPQLPAHQLENLTENVFRWMKNCKTNVTQVMTLGRKAFWKIDEKFHNGWKFVHT